MCLDLVHNDLPAPLLTLRAGCRVLLQAFADLPDVVIVGARLDQVSTLQLALLIIPSQDVLHAYTLTVTHKPRG